MAVAEALKVELRESRGKQAAKQMRREGRIPGVVYAADRESIPVSVSAYDFATITRHHGLSALVKLEGLPDGETIAVYKQLQLHPVRYETQHIDFQAVPEGSKVAISESLLPGMDALAEFTVAKDLAECQAECNEASFFFLVLHSTFSPVIPSSFLAVSKIYS